MAIDPATAKQIQRVIIEQIADEEKRQRLVIGIIIGIVVFILLLAIPILLLVSAWEAIKDFFGWETEEEMKASAEYATIYEIKEDYGNKLESIELTFNGELPMPVNNAVVTCEFGNRIHPVYGGQSFHTGIDLAGTWHTQIMSVLDGKVVFSGVSGGYGNCVKIEHQYKNETIYTLYAHLAEIYVYEGQEVKQGNVIGTQGGDPVKDNNPGTSTGSHLHFEIRKSSSGDFQNPRDYLYGG